MASPLRSAALILAACGWFWPALAAGPERIILAKEGGLNLQQAVNEAGRLLRQDSERPVIVQVEGMIRLSRPVRLTREHSGTARHPLVIRGLRDGSSHVTGAIRLEPLGTLDTIGGHAALPRSHAGQILVYQLPGDFAGRPLETRRYHVKPSGPTGLEVFDAQGPLQPARYPDEGFVPLAPTQQGDTEHVLRLQDASRLKQWQGERDLWMSGYPGPEWSYEVLPVGKVGRGALHLAEKSHYERGKTPAIAVFNAAAELDRPGEYYRDITTNRLYVWPRGAGRSLEVSLAETLFQFDDVGFVRLEHLTLSATRGDAITVNEGRFIQITQSVLRDMAGRAIVIEGGMANVVDGVLIERTGEGGVVLNGGDRRSLTPSAHRVSNAIIRDFARLGRTYKAAVELRGVGQHVTGNYIHNGPHMAIYLHGNEHRIRGNEITDVVRETSDSGAIYAGRDWTERGTIIEGNFLHHIGSKGRYVMGVYLDDLASGFTIRGNLFADVTQSVFIGGGRDNQVEDNVFIGPGLAIHLDQRAFSWAKKAMQPDSALFRSLDAMPFRDGVWAKSYPRLADLPASNPGAAAGNGTARNLILGMQPYRFEDGAAFDPLLSGPDRPPHLSEAAINRLKGLRHARDMAFDLSGMGHIPFAQMDRSLILKEPFASSQVMR